MRGVPQRGDQWLDAPFLCANVNLDCATVPLRQWSARPGAFTFFSSNVAVGGKDNNTETYTINADVNIPGVSSDATAVLLIGTAQWTNVSLSPVIPIEMTIGNHAIALYGQVNNKTTAGAGIMPLTAGGTFIIRVSTANAGVFSLFCLGYLR